MRVSSTQIITGLVCTVAGLSFATSAPSLVDLADQAGIVAGLSWTLPALIDGTVLVATMCVPALARSTSRMARIYPKLVAITGTAISVVANAAHAVDATISSETAVLVGATAPLALLVSSHLLLLLSQTKTSIVRPRAATKPAVAPIGAPATKRPAGISPRSSSREAIVAKIRAESQRTGVLPSARDVASLLGASERTARRLLSEMRGAA